MFGLCSISLCKAYVLAVTLFINGSDDKLIFPALREIGHLIQ